MGASALLEEVCDSYERLTEEELANLGIVLGAYRSFRGNRRAHIAYVTMPVTSGRRLYDVLSKERVRTVGELTAKRGKEALWELVVQPNIAEGIAFADSLGRREDLLFIAPSVFEAKRWRWSQDAYMSLWYRIIGEMAGKHVLIDGWEYSNGGVDEVLFSLFLRWRILRMSNLVAGAKRFGIRNFHPDMSFEERIRELEEMWKIRITNVAGVEICLDSALKACVDAIYYLRERDLPYDALAERAWKMVKIPAFVPSFYSPDSSRLSEKYMTARERLMALSSDH